MQNKKLTCFFFLITVCNYVVETLINVPLPFSLPSQLNEEVAELQQRLGKEKQRRQDAEMALKS